MEVSDGARWTQGGRTLIASVVLPEMAELSALRAKREEARGCQHRPARERRQASRRTH